MLPIIRRLALRFPRVILSSLAPLVSVIAAAHSTPLNFDELAAGSGSVLVGRVASLVSEPGPNGNMIFTRTVVDRVQTIAGDETSSTTITLRYPGGVYNGVRFETCMTPHLVIGQEYLFFLEPGYDPAMPTITPFLGGEQGTFELIRDSSNGSVYPVRAGRAILGRDNDGNLLLSEPVDLIENGTIKTKRSRPALPAAVVPDPVPAGPRAKASAIASVNAAKSSAPEAALDLASFATLVERARKGPAPAGLKSKMRTSADEDPRLLAMSKKITAPTGSLYTKQWAVPEVSGEAPAPAKQSKGANQPVGPCGYHKLPIVMEQVPANWWNHAQNEQVMATYNRFMDVFRTTPDNGEFGSNQVNEFGGFESSAVLEAIYGFRWGLTTLGVTCSSFEGVDCGEIYESDVFFNPAFNFAEDPLSTLTDSSRATYVYRAILNHEVGHVWGHQRGPAFPETYDYDEPTVMQAGYRAYGPYGVYEDGFGIQPADARAIRNNYSGRTPVLNPIDTGVETYKALNGLVGATFASSNVLPGEWLELRGITVVNNSINPVNNLVLRAFLSTDNVIVSGDALMGDYIGWSTFPASTHWTGDISVQVPEPFPAGEYYFGLILNINNFGDDDYRPNNTTTLSQKITIRPDDNWEPNDTIAMATDITAHRGVSTSTYLPWLPLQSDDDFYRVRIGAGMRGIQASASFQNAAGDIDLNLYDEIGNLYRVSQDEVDSESVRMLGLPPGDYFLRAFYGNAGNPYDLYWSDIAPEDNFEDNDSYATPWDLRSERGLWLTLVEEGGEGFQVDEDYYLVNVGPSNNALVADLKFLNDEGDLNLRLLAVDGREIAATAGTKDTEHLIAANLPPGDYVLQVAGPNRGGGYDLLWIDALHEVTDPYEPNDTPDTAFDLTSLGSGAWLSDALGRARQAEEDVYKVVVPPGADTLILRVRLPEGGTVQYRIWYKPQSRGAKGIEDPTITLTTGSVSGTEEAAIPVSPITAGEYLITISGDNIATEYDLAVEASVTGTVENPDLWTIF